jgi:hypothetical protein
MSDGKVLEVQHGIWIDEQWLHDADLGTQLQVMVKPGEIRIIRTPDDAEGRESSRGWEIFRSLGQDAQPGRLPDAAAEHDRYLYGKGG